MSNFVSLHNQTDYSILDSLISVKELFQRAKELNQSAIAITDHGSLASAWAALKESKSSGIKLIMGCECYFVDDTTDYDNNTKFAHIVLLAKNLKGYQNLLTLNKKAFDQGYYTAKKVCPLVDWKLLEQYKEGLLCLTACGNGIVSQLLMQQKMEDAEKALLKLKNMFGDDLGVEVQSNNMNRQANHFNYKIDQFYLNRQLIQLGKKHSIKIIPTCNSHYLAKEDAEVHDALLAIGSHQSIFSNFRLKYPTPEFYLKSEEEVIKFFNRNYSSIYGENFGKELCDNTLEFANRCEMPEWIDPKFTNPDGKEFPDYPVKDENDYEEFKNWLLIQDEKVKKLTEASAYLRYKCFSNFEQNFKHKINELEIQKYIDRMEEELDVLDGQGFSGYFLIVWDFIRWAIDNKISPPSPGRGSISGCLIAYFLGMHKADPFKYGLIFERFHTRDKTKPPDIDTDIATSGRDKVVQYLFNKYGQDHVAGISNFNTITAKVFVKDVARACELGGSKDTAIEIGNNIADMIPDLNKSKTFDSLKQYIPLVGEYAKSYPQFDKFSKIYGKNRNFSAHAAALVISKRPLVGLVPLRKDYTGYQLIEYEKDTTEDNNLLKMDILGLSSLDDITSVLSLINRDGHKLSLEDIDFEAYDKKTYDLISAGETYGVFQLGTSGGMIDLCKRIKPKSIDDLALITTLGRPAAKNIRDEFIKTREGKKSFTLLHPLLKGAFEKTYGYGLFDESILQLGRDIAKWTFNEADRIRKMIKDKGKNPEKNKKLREEFIRDAHKNNNIDPIIGTRIWDEEIKKFQEYTFNRAHATTYSFTSFITAYLKAHYPLEFLLANLMSEVLSSAPKAKGNVIKVKQELKEYGVKILPPNINTSEITYSIKDKKTLLTGFQSIKYVGDDAIDEILSLRPFKSFFDFMTRVSSKKVRANNIQALIGSGAMDCFKLSRRQMYLYCSDYRKKLTVWLKTHDPKKETFEYPFPQNEKEWTNPELYAVEYYYMGEGFICKKPEAYGIFFDNFHSTIDNLTKLKEKDTISGFKGIIVDTFELKIKKENSKLLGKSMYKTLLEDKNGKRCYLTTFPDGIETLNKRIKQINSKAIFEPGTAIQISGHCNVYEDQKGIIFENINNLAIFPSLPEDFKTKKTVSLKVNKNIKKNSLLEEIQDGLINEGLLNFDDENELFEEH